MDPVYEYQRTFEKIAGDLMQRGEYEKCSFEFCDFNNAHLNQYKFVDCNFKGCNLSLAKLDKAVLIDIRFIDCKMLGLRFDLCDPFGFLVAFENCTLDHSSFYKLRIKNTVFRKIQMQHVDFTEADLTSALFEHCDLINAKFENTILEKSDFRTSFNYSIDPDRNKIKKAKFSMPGILGLLDKYDIEISGTAP